MFKRAITSRLLNLAGKFPVVTLTGPRQSGKTTLVKEAFPEKPYANLEDLEVRELATTDPKKFLMRFPNGAILDEIQQVPSLLSFIQPLVDEKDREGMFILTGSHQLELHQAISQSLAGRTALLNLLPMSLAELKESGFDLTLEQALLKGGYPRIYNKNLEPNSTYLDYIRTYMEKDLRQLIHIKDLVTFQRFLRLCVGRIGQILNYESLSNDVGVSSTTVKHWLSILEASFLIVQLPPYFENFGKRVIKSPKIYFTDVGIACALLGIETENQLTRDPLWGNLVENLIFLELAKYRYNQGKALNLFFFRDLQGKEVDFIFQRGHELVPIEAKAAYTFNKEFMTTLNYFQDLAKERCPLGYVIYAGNQEQVIGDVQLLNFKHSTKALD